MPQVDPLQALLLATQGRRSGPPRRQLTPLRNIQRPGAVSLADMQSRAIPRQGDSGESRSLFRQFSDAITGLPRGIAHLGMSAGKTIAMPFHLGYDMATGDLTPAELATPAAGYNPFRAEASG